MHALVMLHLSSAMSGNHHFSSQSLLLITTIVNDSIYHFARYYDDFTVCYTDCDGDESQLSDCYIETCSYQYCYSGAVIIACCKKYL